ncbi:MAG: PHP domain-containing protein [Roseburia sp.]|nr:PHP domain-containing protein [Roseburia sp.]
MNQRLIDLHVHSTESDGTLTPEEVVRAAAAAGLSAIALTDHDTASGVAKAAKTAAALRIELIAGIELSTEYQLPGSAGGKEVHIVGLFIDPAHPTLLEKTRGFRECRNLRNEKMVAALQKEGFSITTDELIAANPDSVITRANIARFLYQTGQIKSVQKAFEKYIGDGCRCYVGRFKVTPMEAVELIHAAGGVAVLAHPLLYHLKPAVLQQLIDDLKQAGLDGIEAVYSTYTAADEQYVRKLAEENGLLISGGSDFHGANKPAIQIGSGHGNLRIPYEVLDALRGRHVSRMQNARRDV